MDIINANIKSTNLLHAEHVALSVQQVSFRLPVFTVFSVYTYVYTVVLYLLHIRMYILVVRDYCIYLCIYCVYVRMYVR